MAGPRNVARPRGRRQGNEKDRPVYGDGDDDYYSGDFRPGGGDNSVVVDAVPHEQHTGGGRADYSGFYAAGCLGIE